MSFLIDFREKYARLKKGGIDNLDFKRFKIYDLRIEIWIVHLDEKNPEVGMVLAEGKN